MSAATPPAGEAPRALPDKLYFRIGEVAKVVGVKPYVLRYWESEFSILRPGKSSARHRLYRRKDVEALLEIRRLLYTERYTIQGAKRRLREGGRLAPAHAAPASVEPSGNEPSVDAGGTLARVREELLELYEMLGSEPGPALRAGERAK